MADRKPAKKSTAKPAKSTSATAKASQVFTAEERRAMREIIKERRAAGSKAEQESAVLAKIDAMAPADRAMAKRIHALIKASAPGLSAKLWYGMPAYAKDGNNIVCFFQDAQKFKMRYATLGFSDKANLDDGSMWPNSFALKKLTAAEEKRISALVKKAVG